MSLGSSTLAGTSGDECGYLPQRRISLNDVFCLCGLEDRYHTEEHWDSDSPLQTPQSLRSPEASDEDNKTPPHPREPAPTKRAKWLRLQQRERVRELGLKEEEVGKWVQEGCVGDYGQNIWADWVMRLALSMGNVDGSLIEYAIETAPVIIKDHLDDRYDSWEEFTQAVREIPATRLRQGKEELEQN